jgi:hypothetical protein
MISAPLHTVDRGTPDFEAGRSAVDIVCLGDSLTGFEIQVVK